MTIFTSLTWREWSQLAPAGYSVAVTDYDSISAAPSGCTVSVASTLPVANLGDRRLSKVCRITSVGHDNGDGSFDHGMVHIRWTSSSYLTFQPYVAAMALLNCDLRAAHDSRMEAAGTPVYVGFFCWVGGWPGVLSATTVQTNIVGRQFKGPAYSPYSGLFNQNVVGVATSRLTGASGAGYDSFAACIALGNMDTESITFDVGRFWVADGFMDATGQDGLFVPIVRDTSVVRRSRDQQVYVDPKRIFRGLQFSISGIEEQQTFDLDCYNLPGDDDGPPSLAACAVEAGSHGEVLFTSRPTDMSSGTGHFTKFGAIYGVFDPPGLQFRDQRGGKSLINGTVIEAR